MMMNHSLASLPGPASTRRRPWQWLRKAARVLLAIGILGIVMTATPGLVEQAQASPPLFGPSLSDIVEEFQDRAAEFEGTLTDAGRSLFWILFALQFLLVGLNLLVRGPMSLSAHSYLGFSNPLANLVGFFIIGVLAWIIVFTAGPDGWVRSIFDIFNRIGNVMNGCDAGDDNCVEPDALLNFGLQLGAGILSKATTSGADSNSALIWILQSLGAGMMSYIAYMVLAIHLALTKTVFELVIVAAPLFLSVIIFRPLSGLASGYFSFIVYLGVKLLMLYMLASVASSMGFNWLGFLSALLLSAVGLGDLILFNFQIMGTGLFLMTLAIYLPGKAAAMISQRLNFDFYALLNTNPTT